MIYAAVILTALLLLVHGWHQHSRGKVMSGDDVVMNRMKFGIAALAAIAWIGVLT